MTSIIGIKTSTGNLEGIVLGSDTQLNTYDSEDNMISKKPVYKITSSRFWAIAFAGTVTEEFKKFYGWLRGLRKYSSSKEIVDKAIRKAIETNYFEEINNLNREDLNKGTDLEDLHAFILASIEPEPGLWHINEFGTLQNANQIAEIKDEERPFEYLCSGSGYDELRNYIEKQTDEDVISSDSEVNIPTAIDMTMGALKASTKDAATGGPMDIVVLYNGEVKSYGPRFKHRHEEADKQVVNEIKREHAPIEE